ncbi:hypothetical protein D3C77_637160 [compost metagenome]
MHPAQALDDLGEGSVGGVLAGNVTHRDRHLHTLPAQLFCSFYQQLLVAVDQADFASAALDHQPGCFQAQA